MVEFTGNKKIIGMFQNQLDTIRRSLELHRQIVEELTARIERLENKNAKTH